ncbi:conserved protein of unknown function; putative membrane protein [hydrothermal vent metagenome]|uniref:Paraquat-inducible protein A n=1 Tax=hydrothermal vent metagenome TaxID=652676 RepID=A0A1W1BYU9_9ZZZZ
MKQIISVTIALLLLATMAFYSIKAYDSAKSYEIISQIVVDRHNVAKLSSNKLKKIGDMLSLGLYGGYEKVLNEEKELLSTQKFYSDRAIKFTINALGAAMLLLLLYFVMNIRFFTTFVTLSALIALASGLFMPIMMMSIHREVEYLGDVVLSMESKSVLGSIVKLFDAQDYIVGGALLLFSIVVPFLKNISMLFVAIFAKNRRVHMVVHFFKVLGKWSMADVFVVATFLVYLSGSRGDMSRAEIEVGFYFFLAYVILSMVASLSADKILRDVD